MQARTYQFASSTLTVRFGDIVEADAQVIVSSDDCYITMGGGVSAAILRAGGEAIPLDAAKKVPATIGDVVVTTAGTLNAQYVFHAITLGPNPEELTARAIIERTTRRCMRLLDSLQLSSIAFPAIGAGAARFSYDEVASQMADVIAEELLARPSAANVSLYLLDRFHLKTEIDFIQFFEEFAVRVPLLAKNVIATPSPAMPSQASYQDLAAETQEEYNRLRIHNLRRLIVELEEQRGKLEQQLILVLNNNTADADKHVRKALMDNQELRLQYLGELQAYLAQGVATATPARSQNPLRVFVSSTYVDLVAHRAAVKDSIARCDLFFRGMEHFGASADSEPPAKQIVEEVRNADVYVGIFGVRYGSVDPATGLSMTELEFREAETGKKPMLLYLMHQDTSVPLSCIETDPEGQRKLNALKTHILKQHLTYQFRGIDDLRGQVLSDLTKLKAEWLSNGPA